MNTCRQNRAARGLLLVSLICAVPVIASAGVLGPPTEAQIRIVVNLTAAGRKLPEATPRAPVIYFPVFAEDLPGGGAEAPAKTEVQRWLAEALARRGYLVVNPQHDQPSQLLVFQWGVIEPQIDELEQRQDDEGVPLQQRFWNQGEMLDLVAGKARPMPWWQRATFLREAIAGRYFLRIMAYDYAAAKQRKQTLLWHARVSTYADGVTLKDVLATLIKAGGPHFGRETKRPLTEIRPYIPAGRVDLGESTVKEYLPATTTPDQPRGEKK